MRYRLKTATWIVVREPTAPPARVLSNPAAVRELARDLLRDADDDREHCWLVLLNSQHHYRLSTLISVGTLNASLVHPREIFGPAVRYGAAALILLHNHPSGDPTPSREDIRLTRQLVECARVFDIHILDHVVIGNGTDAFTSFAERGLL